jgi:hypothetical protein
MILEIKTSSTAEIAQWLVGVESLRILSLIDCVVDEVLLMQIAAIANLELIDLKNSGVDTALIARVRSRYPQLHISSAIPSLE